MKNAFGGRVRCMVTSSAPISRDVLDFIKVLKIFFIYSVTFFNFKSTIL